jgi:hypothetical protein
VQQLGPQRIDVQPLITHSYHGDNYERQVRGYAIKVDELSVEEIKIFDALEFFNRPATPEFLRDRISKMRAVMARTSESVGDIEIVLETYSQHLEQYPPDVVAFVIDKTIAQKKWFPLISELCAEMDSIVRFRRALLEAFKKKSSPVLGGQSKPQLEAPASRHDKARAAWSPQDWQDNIAEAEAMIKLAEKNPTMFSVEEWKAELEKRKTELPK